jgi:hypothetical protein
MLHRLPEDVFQQKLQGSQLDYVVASRAAATSLRENYVGLPLARGPQPLSWENGPITSSQLLLTPEEMKCSSDMT